MWHKLGLLYEPKSIHPNLWSHAANPLPIHLDGDLYRIFYSSRNQQNRSSVSYVDADIKKQKIVYVHQEPIFEYGPPGSFFSHGVSIGHVYKVGQTCYMLFMGWQCFEDQHWQGKIGRLILKNQEILELDSFEPFLSTDAIDPISLSYPWIIQEPHIYHMWYGSTKTWDAGNNEMIHSIDYAQSKDGHTWTKMGNVIPHCVGMAQAFSRPTVIGNSQDGFHMWFSYRSGTQDTYKIGYAHSKGDLHWDLILDHSGLLPSSQGWDSEMVEYPFVFQHKDQLYMLYNGNGYGKTGFGLAVEGIFDQKKR